MTPQRLLTLSLIACACGPARPDPSDDATSSPPASTSSASTATPPNPTTGNEPTSDPEPGTSVPGNPAGFTSEDPSATSAVTSETTTGVPPETTGELIPCNINLQDCPEGQKCSVFAMSPDDLFQGMFKCVPLDPNPQPPHAPCDVFEDPADGTDNCELGSICLFPDAGGVGECFSFCNFNTPPICQPPGDLCIGATCQSCTWSYCDTSCDVLDPAACDPGELCAPGIENSWICIPDSSGDAGQQDDPCEFVNDCDPGFVCLEPAMVPECNGDQGCCTTACDVDAPNTCPNKDQGAICKPWYPDGTAPSPELAKVGVCATP